MKKIRNKILEFLTPQPEIQEEYVDKVVHLLRRDFPTAQQNEIVLSVIKKLSELRKQDMIDLETKYDTLQRDNNNLLMSVKL